jgi:putative transposase
MKPLRFTEEQITYALKQAEAGEAVIDVCRRMGISQQTCSQWRRKYHGLGVPVTCPQLLCHSQC